MGQRIGFVRVSSVDQNPDRQLEELADVERVFTDKASGKDTQRPQLEALLAAGCIEILLDNMDTATMAEAVRLTRGRATLEASGGLTLERAREVAATGVDFISVGALTHSVRILDLGLDLR